MLLVAKSIIERMNAFHVQIRVKGNDLDFLVPKPGKLGRPANENHVGVAYEDGAIRELEDLVHSVPDLRWAVREIVRQNA